MKIFVTFAGDLTGQLTTPGGVVHVIEVCRNIHMLGHEVTLFVPNYGSYPENVPFRIVYVPILQKRYLETISFAINLLLWLVIYIMKEGCDLIYENDVTYSLGGILCSKILFKKHFMNAHGFSPDEMEMGGHSWLRIKIVELFQRVNYGLSDGLFCVTPYIVEKVHQHYKVPKSKMVFIFNGVNEELCRPLNRKEVFDTLKLSPEKYYVGFIGYLYPWSGLETLIDAASRVVQEITNMNFIIVGHGTWGAHLKQITLKHRVQDYFIFTDYQPWRMIPLYCNAFDVGVTPYVGQKGVGRYRSSMKTLEYLASGTPVIITHAEGVSDIVEKSGCGIVIPPDDPDAFADAIIEVIRDSKRRKKMGEIGRQLVLDNYTWKHTAKHMMDFVNKKMKKSL